MAGANAALKLPTVSRWSEIERWTVDPGKIQFGTLPAGWKLLQVREFVSPEVTAEKVEPDKDYLMAGVRLYGEGVFVREAVKGRDQSARYLFPAKPGAFIYNRLFAWRGTFAIVPDGPTDLYVSNEFPQFEVDERKVLPEFLYLLFGTRPVIAAVNAASIGSAAVSRNRFKEEDFLKFRVPVPPLTDQRKIIAFWREGIDERARAEAQLGKLVAELNQLLLDRTRAFETITRSKVFVADYSHAAQWDLKAGRASAFMAANPDFVRLGDFTAEGTETIKPWERSAHEWPVYGVNNKDGVFLNSHQLGSDFNAAYKRIKKDWFFHNPTRANVGSLGIVGDVPDDAITSPEYQVWRLTGGFLPGFVALLVRTDYFLSLVEFNRVGGVKQRMYYANLAEIRLPEIATKIQQDFAKRREHILIQLGKARAQLINRKIEIEKMILGTAPLPGQ